MAVVFRQLQEHKLLPCSHLCNVCHVCCSCLFSCHLQPRLDLLPKCAHSQDTQPSQPTSQPAAEAHVQVHSLAETPSMQGLVVTACCQCQCHPNNDAASLLSGGKTLDPGAAAVLPEAPGQEGSNRVCAVSSHASLALGSALHTTCHAAARLLLLLLLLLVSYCYCWLLLLLLRRWCWSIIFCCLSDDTAVYRAACSMVQTARVVPKLMMLVLTAQFKKHTAHHWQCPTTPTGCMLAACHGCCLTSISKGAMDFVI